MGAVKGVAGVVIPASGPGSGPGQARGESRDLGRQRGPVVSLSKCGRHALPVLRQAQDEVECVALGPGYCADAQVRDLITLTAPPRCHEALISRCDSRSWEECDGT